MPKFALISTFLGFPVSHACLLWVAGLFSDNRSTRLLPKPFWIVECTTLLKLSGFLSCQLVHHHDWVLKPSFKPMSYGLYIRKFLVLDLLTQNRYIKLMKAWTYDAESGAFGNWAATRPWVMAMVRVFLLGIHFISNHLNCSSKELFRPLLSIPSEVLLIADQTRKLVLQRPVGHLPDTPSAALETSVRYEHKQRFSA